MTYPQQPYPPQGQPGYPQQYPQPGYPAAPPQAPQYPPQAPPGYYQPPQAPQYPPQAPPQQGYYQPPAAPPGPAPARATLGEFMDQQSGGGGSATSKFFTKTRPQGSWLQLQVARDLLSSDVQQQENDGVLQFFKTGGQPDPRKPKLVLKVPTLVLSSSDPAGHMAVFADGMSSIWLKGVLRDALVAAIGAAGIPEPSRVLVGGRIGGAVITMISAGSRPSRDPKFSDTNLFDFRYTPGGRELEGLGEIDPSAPAPSAPAPPLPDMTAQYQQLAQATAVPDVPAQYQQLAQATAVPYDPAQPYAQQAPGFSYPAPPAQSPFAAPAQAMPAAPPVPAAPSAAPGTPSYPPQAPPQAPNPGYQLPQAPPTSVSLYPNPGYQPPQNVYAPPPQAPGYPSQPPAPPQTPLDAEKQATLQATLARLRGEG